MRIVKFLFVTILAVSLFSCGYSGKERRREPSRESKKNIEIIKEDDVSEDDVEDIYEEDNASDKIQRNNGKYKQPSQRTTPSSRMLRKGRGKPVPVPEEETLRSSVPDQAKIERRVQLEIKIMEAEKNGNTVQFEKLQEEAKDLMKKMSIKEIDEAYKRIKDLKKRM